MELFGEYIAPDCAAYFGSAVVERIEASLGERSLSMLVSFPVPVDASVIKATGEQLKRIMRLTSLDFRYRFPSESFGENYIPTLIGEVCANFPPAEKILEGAEYSVIGEKFKIKLAANGSDILKNLGCDKFIVKLIDERFDRRISVEIESNAKPQDDIETLRKIQNNENKKASVSAVRSDPVSASKNPA